MGIILPLKFEKLKIIIQKKKQNLIKFDIIKKNNVLSFTIIQYLNNKKVSDHVMKFIGMIELIILLNKDEVKITGKNSNSKYIKEEIIDNKTGFINMTKISSDSDELIFINKRQKIQKINDNLFIYNLKPKYEPKYDFQLILNNLNLISNYETIKFKRKNNTFSFQLEIKKINKDFIFKINNQTCNGIWMKDIHYEFTLLDEKLILKFHKSNIFFSISINDQQTILIHQSNFYNLEFEEIITSLHNSILVLPDEEQIIFNNDDKTIKPKKIWIDKNLPIVGTNSEAKPIIYKFIYIHNTECLESIRKNYQINLENKWKNENINVMIKNFNILNLNQIKKILYFSRGYGRHRFGWDYVCREVFLKYFSDDPDGIIIDPFIESTFLWRINNSNFVYSKPWMGFIHSTPTTPPWYNSSKHSLDDLLLNKYFIKSLSKCVGLITLSNHLNNHLKEELKKNKISIPIYTIYHPSGNPSKKFNINNYEQNSILHVGLHLRNFGSFYKLNKNLKKYLIFPTEINWSSDSLFQFIADEIKKTEKDFNLNINEFKNEITCFEKHLISDQIYDQLLSNHILFCDFYDSSANNLIVEAIMSQTPILVNKNPAVVEYLGDDYPFYFNTIDEANKKANNSNIIHETHYYLKTRQSLVSLQSFKYNLAQIINDIIDNI